LSDASATSPVGNERRPLTENSSRKQLEMKALIVGYAMSRLDQRFLELCGLTSWKRVFATVGEQLSIPPASLKNLRDEFDPYHDNSRLGWHKRPLRPNRQRVMGELCDLSDDVLVALVQSLIKHQDPAVQDVIDVMLEPRRPVHNVAERLLTGRQAERFFMENCKQILKIATGDLVDHRDAACGFDFGLRSNPGIAIEVKGLKQSRGPIQFTDREWTEATVRQDDYWLVVIGNLAGQPVPKHWNNPVQLLKPKCRYVTQISTVWTTTVAVL
jgi:hypothetical protein